MHITRKYLDIILSGMEVVLSGFLIIVIIVLIARLFTSTFFSADPISRTGAYYIEAVMTLAIGIEFAKMLFHHTPGTIIEVLLFAISRHMIAEQLTAFETCLGVVSIAGLFAVKKYLFSSFREHEHIICSGQMTVRRLNLRYGLSIPADGSRLLCDVVREHLKRLGLPAEPGTGFTLGDAVFQIDKMENGSIKKVELVKSRSMFDE